MIIFDETICGIMKACITYEGHIDVNANLAQNKSEEEIFELLGATYLEPSKR